MQKSKKVENGKLVKIDADLEDGFEDVKIHGDFFIDPAEKLEDITDMIERLSKDFERESIVEELKSIDAELIGFSAEDIVDVLEKFRGDKE